MLSLRKAADLRQNPPPHLEPSLNGPNLRGIELSRLRTGTTWREDTLPLEIRPGPGDGESVKTECQSQGDAVVLLPGNARNGFQSL